MKANLKRRLEALQQATDRIKDKHPTVNPYASWTTEELEAEMDRFMANQTPEQKAYSDWLATKTTDELLELYADKMRNMTNE